VSHRIHLIVEPLGSLLGKRIQDCEGSQTARHTDRAFHSARLSAVGTSGQPYAKGWGVVRCGSRKERAVIKLQLP
jgi:hypothetical protein